MFRGVTEIHSGIRDNRARGTAHSFIESRVGDTTSLSVVSAYFTSSAYGSLAETLDKIESMRFLFGEPRFLVEVDGVQLVPPAFSLAEDGLSLSSQMRQRAVALKCAAWIKSKVSVRSIRRAGLLHGKLIHVHDGAREHAMVGSSNFTLRGLGFTKQPNIELNLIVDGDRDRRDLLSWFDEIWSDETLTVDVKDEVVRALEHVYRHISPEFLYQKTLFHLFGDFLAEQAVADERFASTAFVETAVWKMLYSFQQDGVRAILSKLDHHGGCILADSVGLGKTLTALAVIKWHELRNQRVLVLCPKKLRENWTEFLAANNSDLNPLRDDRLSYTVLSHTDLNRESGKVGDIDLSRINWAGFDLVVIDESHAFRNASGSRYQRLMAQVILSGMPTRVLMLSATPVNNDLADLQAQLDLIASGRSNAFRALGVPNLSTLIGEARRRFSEWTREGGGDSAALMASLPPSLTTLLDGVSIARSRKHIERHYAETLEKIGHFPVRARPISKFPGVDLEGRFPAFDEIDLEIGSLNLALYNPFAFVEPQHKSRYNERDLRPAGFDQANRETYLVAMMKVGFLKRLESSVSSFGSTMTRMLDRIDRRLAQLQEFRDAKPHSETADVPAPGEEMDGDEDLVAAFEVGGRLKYDLRHLNVEGWEAALRQDRERINKLAMAARAVDAARDAKLSEIRSLIVSKLTKPTSNRDGSSNRKLIFFTAFADTARYLYLQLEPLARSLNAHIGLVTGDSSSATLGKARFQDVLANFAPRSKKRSGMRNMPAEEIDILIATDCISEGQNLQDADWLVNVDIHWNPVRLIQRFGRIDRIGAQAPTIQMINFWPTDDLNQYLNLRERVESRMALVDLSATGDNNLLAEARDTAEGELHWRDEQLRRLQLEIFDLDDAKEGVTLAEFTLDEFRADLLSFARTNEDALRNSPLGLSAIAPAIVDDSAFDPGVIVCLRRKGIQESAINPLDPFYLVYVRDDGSIRHGFGQPKSILSAMEALCTGRSEPFTSLCNAFDDETKHGADLGPYDALMESALADIGRSYASKAATSLAMGRGSRLPDASLQARPSSSYELITWLIVRSENGESA